MTGALMIRCTCGHVVRGEDEERLLAAAREHIASVHPDLAGRITDDDLLKMASAS